MRILILCLILIGATLAPTRAASPPPLMVFAAAYCGTCDLHAGATVQVVVAVYADNPITETLTLEHTPPAGLTLLRTRQSQPGVAFDHPAVVILDYRVADDARNGLRQMRYTAHAGASVGETIVHVQIGRAVVPWLWLPLGAR